MSIAVMQPYIFPYIGYFQLVYAVDTFVFYDDVNFIKGGWINRNKILFNSEEKLFSIHLIAASSFKQINEIDAALDEKSISSFLSTISQAYKKAPYYKDILPLISGVLNNGNKKISALAIKSVEDVMDYLSVSKNFQVSSIQYKQTEHLKKAERLVEICKLSGQTQYINPIGGMELYSKDYFGQYDIELSFIKTNTISYDQGNNKFVPWLSIIDVLMFNSPDQINKFLTEYSLI